jgi:hypothetical protein
MPLFFSRVEFLLNLIDILLKRFVFLHQSKMTCAAQVIEAHVLVVAAFAIPIDARGQVIVRGSAAWSPATAASAARARAPYLDLGGAMGRYINRALPISACRGGKELILASTYTVVLFSVLVQGTSLGSR